MKTSLKATTIFISIIISSSFTPLSKNDWTEKDKKVFLDNCLSNTGGKLKEETALKYCSCVLENLENKYDNPEKALQLSTDEVKKMGLECFKQR